VLNQPWPSSAVLWEIQTALTLTDPRRTVLVFWQTSDVDYVRFREVAGVTFALPPRSVRRDHEELIQFDQNRVPFFAPIPRRGTLGTLLDNSINLGALVEQLRLELGTLPPLPAHGR